MNTDLLTTIREENFKIYGINAQRLSEDARSEEEVARNYRGRLLFELLQNADDAMAASDDRRLYMELAADGLWVANSGRPLDEPDVRGLCGISATTKRQDGPRRATIGHKGMGFKSVLEVTLAPQVYSTTRQFCFDRELGLAALREAGHDVVQAPLTRLPFPVERTPHRWLELAEKGYTTAFFLPFRPGDADTLGELQTGLRALPATLLFLKHLSGLEIVAPSFRQAWTMRRSTRDAHGWRQLDRIVDFGVYRVEIMDGSTESSKEFVLVHDPDVEIGRCRRGLEGIAWAGITHSEVTVAAAVVDGVASPLPGALIHVFLPSAMRCPYPVLVNGAFSCDVSRQQVPVFAAADDYNSLLLHRAGQLLAQVLVPHLAAANDRAAALLLARDRGVQGLHAATLHAAVTSALAALPWVPTDSGEAVPVSHVAVPPLLTRTTEKLRSVVRHGARWGARVFPTDRWCDDKLASILADHGAAALTVVQAAQLLADSTLVHGKWRWDPARQVWVDPILAVLEHLVAECPATSQQELVDAVRSLPLLPVWQANEVPVREALQDRPCFFPPQSYDGRLPLPGVVFFSRDLFWGDIPRSQRQSALEVETGRWRLLFGAEEFKFPEVMKKWLTRRLSLDMVARRSELHSFDLLASVCQLSGRTSQQAERLPSQRFGSQKALFVLARLPLPCRGNSGEERWIPAYQTYFGRDWLGDESVECLWDTVRTVFPDAELPDIGYLCGPERFRGLLKQAAELGDPPELSAMALANECDEEEDDEAALPADELKRWRQFFRWLGANDHLRPVHFHDVEERDASWVQTEHLSRPQGAAFSRVPAAVWEQWAAGARTEVAKRLPAHGRPVGKWLYEVHDIEHLDTLIARAAQDQKGVVGKALFAHLAQHWSALESSARAEVALVEGNPRRRKPVMAYEQERCDAGPNLWLHRLKEAQWCPTPLGPLAPSQCWLASNETKRLFPPQRPFLPVVSPGTSHSTRLAQALGMRTELSPSTFLLDDACTVLAAVQRAEQAMATVPPTWQSTVIRPICRSLVDLLVSARPLAPRRDIHLPVITGESARPGWVPASWVFYAERRYTPPPADLPRFAIEAESGTEAVLERCFGVLSLGQRLQKVPAEVVPALQGADLALFRASLQLRAPAMLARLLADRPTRTDGHKLRRLVEGIVPVVSLTVSTTLDGVPVAFGEGERARAFVSDSDSATAFVEWSSDGGWPPYSDDAEALAEAMCAPFGPQYFEPMLALLHAPDEASFLRILRRAGAAVTLPAPDDAAWNDDSLAATAEPAVHVPPQPGSAPTPQAAAPLTNPVASTLPRVLHPLWNFDDLEISGAPSTEFGAGVVDTTDHLAGRPGSGHGSRGQHSATDLTVLDTLGMRVAIAFEQGRLAKAGGGRVYDVSSPTRIAEQWTELEPVFRHLGWPDARTAWPGFDLLSVDNQGVAERLIELKSSGEAARHQEMTWNEWKSASNLAVRGRYFLYLVGNLRSDLADSQPFVRTIRDPFGQLARTLSVQTRHERSVTLSVHRFAQAEFERLGVRPVRQAAP